MERALSQESRQSTLSEVGSLCYLKHISNFLGFPHCVNCKIISKTFQFCDFTKGSLLVQNSLSLCTLNHTWWLQTSHSFGSSYCGKEIERCSGQCGGKTCSLFRSPHWRGLEQPIPDLRVRENGSYNVVSQDLSRGKRRRLCFEKQRGLSQTWKKGQSVQKSQAGVVKVSLGLVMQV